MACTVTEMHHNGKTAEVIEGYTSLPFFIPPKIIFLLRNHMQEAERISSC